MKIPRNSLQLAFGRQGFKPWNNGYRDSRSPAVGDELKKMLVIKKHLGNNKIPSRVNLGLEVLEVCLEAGCLKMLLGVARHPNAKIAGVGVLYLVVEVGPPIEVFDLPNKVYRVAVPVGFRYKTAFAAQGIAAEQERIVDS